MPKQNAGGMKARVRAGLLQKIIWGGMVGGGSVADHAPAFRVINVFLRR
jgi:hypothetical protein